MLYTNALKATKMIIFFLISMLLLVKAHIFLHILDSGEL